MTGSGPPARPCVSPSLRGGNGGGVPRDGECSLCADLDRVRYDVASPLQPRPFCTACGRRLWVEQVDRSELARAAARRRDR